MQTLLTEVITQIVNEKLKSGSFGVSIINLPEIDYTILANSLDRRKRIELYLLGYTPAMINQIVNNLPSLEGLSYFSTVEEAEKSRNNGDESIFRLHIVKNQELEKISSLRWYDTIDMEQVYRRSCRYVLKKLPQTNTCIQNLIKALGRRDIRGILNFERVIYYLEALLKVPAEKIPETISQSLYMLGLLSHHDFGVGSPTVDKFRADIKRNHDVVRRISVLEQKERENITNYAANYPAESLTRLILKYYRTKSNDLLKEMNLEEVEVCLKSASASAGSKGGSSKSAKKDKIDPTTTAAQLVFNNDTEQIKELMDKVSEAIDNRADNDKSEKIEINIEGSSMQVNVEPATEIISERVSTNSYWGGVIYAEVKNPKDALEAIDKYDLTPFDEDYIKKVKEYLERAKQYIKEEISDSFDKFVLARQKITSYIKRLQDVPMLQVITKKTEFSEYLRAYEHLLSAIKNNFAALWDLDTVGAKDIVNTLVSLDFFFVIGDENFHAIPTPLNPLYLWKYIKLVEEMFDAKDITEESECHLSNEDKSFIIRKAEDIPDPLTLVLLPNTVSTRAECLPIAGKIGCVPIYSTKPQISEGNTGMEAVRQAVIRYMCLYPHSSMMLRIAFINPPSIEAVVGILKKLDKDKEFSAFGSVGIDLSIFRTKEAPSDWIEIEDKSLSEGMLGKIRGRHSEQFNISIINKTLTYSEILSEIKREQHILVVFDPNEKKIDLARNSRQIHIHPLCVPKVYEYNRIQGSVRIRPANEGGIFADYAGIIERLREQPSSFGHRSVFVNSPLKEETYKQLLDKSDWLLILDENLKSWDISLRSTSEKLFYKSYDYRSIGIYSKNSKKFVLGYNQLIETLGNYMANEQGIVDIINSIRAINDDGLLSIVSHSTNSIYDKNHGKGSLGLAIAAIKYKKDFPNSILVGLDTQLAREWLSERENGKLPDLVGLRFDKEDEVPMVDLIEVKTHYQDYSIKDSVISGHAVEQILELDSLIREMFGRSEKITTISRKEILREQIFESLFHSEIAADKKHQISIWLNSLFAGEYSFNIMKYIYHVDFEALESQKAEYPVESKLGSHIIILNKLGSRAIQSIITAGVTSEQKYIENNNLININEVSNCKEITELDVVEYPVTTHLASEKNDDVRISDLIAEISDLNASNDLMVEIKEKCIRLNIILKGYGIKAFSVDESLVQQAARFIRFKIELKPGETIKKLKDKSQDIARELEAFGEIFIDNIKGTRYVGMDVPFSNSGKTLMLLDYLTKLENYPGALNFLSGQAPDGSYQIIDLAKAPHMLIAGTTGSGKTVYLYSIIVSFLKQYSPEKLDLLIVDPKQTDFHFFEGISNLWGGRILYDASEALEALEQINAYEKERRTQLIRSAGCRDIESYNSKNVLNPMKRLVIIIDEYADLVQAAEMQGKEVRKNFEANLCMLAQRVRNLGIHLIIATQQPRTTIVTSSIKAVLPFRVSFRLPSHVDSQTILDRSGAEDLLGKGDMLMITDSDVIRMQGFYISEDKLVEFLNL